MIYLMVFTMLFIKLQSIRSFQSASSSDFKALTRIKAKFSLFDNIKPNIPEKYIHLDHRNFLQNRNWSLVGDYWDYLVQNADQALPAFVQGYLNESTYGVTNLKDVENIGYESEFLSKDTLYTSRKTFALRIGYKGRKYFGYQSQNHVSEDFITVEDDIRRILDIVPNSAGRTDRSVSAVSQIICFATKRVMEPNDILARFREHQLAIDNRVVAYECVRVPRKFNARSRATWRRYLYLFPLNDTDSVDVPFINQMFER
jgi:hypothetical protein